MHIYVNIQRRKLRYTSRWRESDKCSRILTTVATGTPPKVGTKQIWQVVVVAKKTKQDWLIELTMPSAKDRENYQIVRSDEKSPVSIKKKSEKGEWNLKKKVIKTLVDDARIPVAIEFFSKLAFFFMLAKRKRRGKKSTNYTQEISSIA